MRPRPSPGFLPHDCPIRIIALGYSLLAPPRGRAPNHPARSEERAETKIPDLRWGCKWSQDET